MAELKQKILVEVLPKDSIEGWDIQIWTRNPVKTRFQIKEIKGIENIMVHTKHSTIVWIDHRYDINEVAEEIEQLLSSEVKKAFLE